MYKRQLVGGVEAGEQVALAPQQALEGTVDRLAARGLVERLPDPHDRRGVLVRLTPAGGRTVDGALEGLLRREQALLAGLDAADQKRLAGLLRSLVAPFESET